MRGALARRRKGGASETPPRGRRIGLPSSRTTAFFLSRMPVDTEQDAFPDAYRHEAPQAHEDAAAWIHDVDVEALADELRRRTLGRPSRKDLAHVGDELLERAVHARRRELEALAR
jgi:hypothetical protein